MTTSMNGRLAMIQTISVVVCLGVAIAAWVHDPPRHRSAWGARSSTVSSETVELVLDPELLMPPPPEAPGVEPGVSTVKAPLPVEPPGKSAKPRTRPEPGEPDQVALDDQARRYAAALAQDDTGVDGVDGKMGKSAPGADLAIEIREARKSGQKVEIGGGSERELRGDSDPREGTVTKQPPANVEGPKTGPKKIEQGPESRIEIGKPKPLDSTTLSPETVMARILKVYTVGLQRCYSRLLAEQPGARGKVGLGLTVNEAGRVTEASAKTEYGQLSTCIEGQMTSWTFPVPKDEDHEATSAAFAVSLALQPD
jgi:hypothetical protein